MSRPQMGRTPGHVAPYKGPKIEKGLCRVVHPDVGGVSCHLDEGMHPGKPHRGVSLEPFTVHEWGVG